VVYTGKDTKIMLNSQKRRMKTSKLEKKLNKVILIVLAMQMVLCFVIALINAIYFSTDAGKMYTYADVS